MWVIYPKTMSEVDNHVSSFIVLPGCSYRVKLEANPHDGRTYIQTDYKVPGNIISFKFNHKKSVISYKIERNTNTVVNFNKLEHLFLEHPRFMYWPSRAGVSNLQPVDTSGPGNRFYPAFKGLLRNNNLYMILCLKFIVWLYMIIYSDDR